MKKTYKLDNLDCPTCAAKMSDAIEKIDGVISVNVNFMMQKLTLEADDASFDDVLKKAVKTMKRVEPDCNIIM